MKLKNIISSALLLACVASLNSCKNDDYELPEMPNASYVENTQQAFFSNTGVETTIEITPDGNTFSIPVKRMGRDAATVKVTSEVLGENLQNIQGGESITFAAGEAEGLLHYTYDPSAVELGQFDTLVVTIAPEFATAYGANTMTFLVGQSEPWVSLGTGYFADEFQGGNPYPVEIMQNGVDPRRFRIMKPYDEMAATDYPSSVTGASELSEYMEITLLQPGDNVGGVTITQEGLVYFTQTAAGYYEGEGYGSDCVWHVADGYVLTSDNTRAERFPNGLTEDYFVNSVVTAYQEADADGNVLPATIQLAGWYGATDFGPVKSWYFAEDASVRIKITFPGVQIFDLSASIAFDGVSYDFSGKNAYANITVELGEDIAGANIYIFKWNEDFTDYYIDNAELGVTASGTYKVLFSEMPDGYYFFYVETYNEDESDGLADYTDPYEPYCFVDGELVVEEPTPDEDEGGEGSEVKLRKAAKANGHKLMDRAKMAKLVKAYKAKK